MKVVMLTYLGEESGVYTHTKNLVSRITKYPDVEMHLIGVGTTNSKTKQFGATIHFIEVKKFLGSTFFYSLPFRKKILEIKPDILHIQSYARYYYLSLVLMKKYPTIVTMHSDRTKELINLYRPSLKRSIVVKIDTCIEKLLLRSASVVVALNPYLENYIKKKSNRKIVIIPNGINLDELQKIKPKDDIKHPSLFFIGRLEKIKGVDILLKAVSTVQKTIPDITIYIAGTGNKEDELKNLVKKLNIEKNVIFLGYISGNEKWSYFKSIDISVIPSREDAFPNVLLETSACVKPVVASNVGGIPYVVENGKTGLLFKSGDAEDLANKIVFLLQNKELREDIAKAGQEKAKEYSWDKIADKTYELYLSLFNPKTFGFIYSSSRDGKKE